MQQELFENAKIYAKKNHRRRIWHRIVRGLGCIVVFCTTYALILPAITQESDTFCGIEAHVHETTCYAESTSQLDCSAVHVHTAECVDGEGNNLCGKADYVVHTHDAACLGETGNLVCVLPEIKVHVHVDECYEILTAETHDHGTDCYTAEKGDLFCEMEEIEGHTHGDSCYTLGTNYVCQKEETEGHAHDEGCHETLENLICQSVEEDHVHDDTCYETTENLVCQLPEAEAHAHDNSCLEKVLSCELEESSGHQHEDACYAWTDVLTCEQTVSSEETASIEKTLVCTHREVKLHTHTEQCYTDSKLVCGQLEVLEHVHGENCFTASGEEGILTCQMAEHTHELMCYSNPDADLEIAADWEQTFAHVELTGVWEDDVLAIAKTQLGYHESTRNYMVWEDDSTHGYTRYGEWFGVPYGDWCAMFASFCLHYAGVEGMPLNNSCDPWIATLSAEDCDLYRPAAEHTPKPGELIFFDWNVNGNSEHVGIVAEIVPATETETAKIRTIEGNSSNCVQYVTYEADAAVILGYAVLPYRPTKEEQAQIDEVIAMIDAMPSADEIDAKMLEYEDAEDYDGLEVWYTEVSQQVARVYQYYSELTEDQQKLVTNRDKLLELEYIWSVATYSSVITSDAPTPTWYTSTKDFIELNLYDYTYGINSKWENDKKYPGFQWNGGAYSNDSGDSDSNDYRYYYNSTGIGIPNAITDRYFIDSIDFGNSIITNYQYQGSNYVKSTTAMSVGKLYNNSSASSTGKINWLWYDGSDYGTTTNRPVGLSTNYQSLKNTLVDGYPALSDGTSLAYLFGGTSESYVIKQNSESIDGLFQQNSVTGEYSYNSRTNHAQYSNNKFTLYEEIITPNFITYPFGNFLPFNTISDTKQATQVGAFNYEGGMKAYVDGIIADLDADIARDDDGNGTTADYGDTSRKQLKTMLQEYQENWSYYTGNSYSSTVSWKNLSSAMAIKDYFNGVTGGDTPSSDLHFLTQAHLDQMYNIDWDVATNFFFGMEMKMTFMQPKNGYTGNDTNGDGASDYPMIFYFTGDDDVWVYIDDVLFLDLTGIHRHVGGKIDFVNGMVYYYELDVENGGDVSATPYAHYSFEYLFRQAGWTDAQIDAVLKPLDSNGNRTFKDYTTHTFNFYYMERGSGSSVCRLNFNFPLLKKNSITVTKENTTVKADGTASDSEVLGNPDYYFNIVTPNNALFVGPQSVTGVSQYKILDSAGNEVGEGTVDQYGIFTLKAGQTAVFEDIDENEGEFFVQELIKAEDNEQYESVYVNDAVARYGKLIEWNHRTYFSDNDDNIYTGPYGYQWYGYSGYDTDASSNSAFYFEQQNHVDVSTLASLSITKNLQTYVAPLADTLYRMYVTLDDVPLPVGTTYTVGSGTRTVSEAGYIEIAAGETATISNIISGTKFTVKETEASASGYTVSYNQTGAEDLEDDGTYISGIIRVNADVTVTVTNSERGATVTIPGTKSLAKPDGEEHTYSFELVQVMSKDDLTVVSSFEKRTASATVTDNAVPFSFTLTYLQPELIAENVALPAQYYYMIMETADTTGTSLIDSGVYVAEVTVYESDDGITAAVTGMWKDGKKITDRTAVFTNTLVGNLSMSKSVNGSSTDQSFGFNITLESGDSGVDLTGMTFQITGKNADGTDFNAQMGTSFGFTICGGESLTVTGIPIGVKWTITETDAAGFIPSYEVTSGTVAEPVDGNTASGTIVLGNTNVAFTNTQLYELPETGGAGVTTYTMAGLMLMLCSAAFLLYRYKKRRREGY